MFKSYISMSGSDSISQPIMTSLSFTTLSEIHIQSLPLLIKRDMYKKIYLKHFTFYISLNLIFFKSCCVSKPRRGGISYYETIVPVQLSILLEVVWSLGSLGTGV